MTPARNQKNREILIVADDNWVDRIAARLSISSQSLGNSATVFQAVASVAVNQKNNIESTVLILVDPLDRQEMDIFQTLAPLSLVTTWALSSLNQPNQKKFQQALANGAAGGAVLNSDCSELARLIETLRKEPEINQELTPEPQGFIEQTKPIVIPDHQQAVQKRQPPATAIIEKTVDEDEEMELLSDAELEALLGPAQADNL